MKIKLRRTEKQDTCNDEDGEIYGFDGEFIIDTDDHNFLISSTGIECVFNLSQFPASAFSYVHIDDINEEIKNGYIEIVKD